MTLQKVAVIGSGVMGSGIAAHIANAGVPVALLDIVPEGAKDRTILAKTAVGRMLKADPAPFMHKRAARLVTPGNIEDDLALLADADWIIEVVLENPAVKTSVFKTIDANRKPGSIVSSNTSTIPLEMLVDGQSDAFRRDFLITHFFNPPRYMRLLEIVRGPDTRDDVVETITAFADRALGKGVVPCNDRPGFIANRIGTFWIQAGISMAIEMGISVEEADAILSRPFNIPKTGIFGLVDLVGLDLMPHVVDSMLKTLPPDDAYRAIAKDEPLVRRMIADGYTGRKGKGGFYRLNTSGGGKVKEALDLQSGEYAPAEKPKPEAGNAGKASGLTALLGHDSAVGRYAWAVMSATLSYAADLVPEIADDIAAVDSAMRLGYNWKYGPFELIDRIGGDWFAAKLDGEGRPIPAMLTIAEGNPFYRVTEGQLEFLGTDGTYHPLERPEGVLLLADIKRRSTPIKKNGSASLWDIGDGVLCVEFTSKMNAIDQDTLAIYESAIKRIGDGSGDWKALVIYNEGDNFSVGANLGLALFAVNIALWGQIEQLVEQGQQVYRALRYAPFPVVAAPSGMALGGGCEILLHADHVQAHAETYTGLVEVGVGLLPAWGGSTSLLTRHTLNKKRPGGPMPPLSQTFETISLAKVAKSAAEAREMLFLRETDGVTMNRDRLLFEAKQKALELSQDYTPPEPPVLNLPGPTARTAMGLAVEGFHLQGKATDHDVIVSGAVADVLSGGDTDITDEISEDRLYALERKAFMALIKTPATIDRIEHMLDTGKPLRN